MTDQLPKLSIVMPVFNGVEYTLKMIDSIRANSFTDWELLAIDDGSTDENFERISQHLSGDPRIQYKRREAEPKGAQTCRNTGFAQAKGEYVIFFDSDDYITPDCLEQRVEALSERPDLDFMVFPSGIVSNDVYSASVSKYAYGYPIFDDDLGSFARRILPFVVWNNIYRTESLRRIGVSWDTNLRSLQDADFNVQTILGGLKYDYFAGSPTMGYRIDASSGSVSKKATSPEHQRSTLYAIEKFYNSYQERFGHKYDRNLFHGVLTLYNWIMGDGMILPYANQMALLVRKYSPFYGMMFKIQIIETRFLNLFMPQKRARQIPMMCFLLKHRSLIKTKLKNISKCRQQ